MIYLPVESPVETLPVDSWPYLLYFCNLLGKPNKWDQGFQDLLRDNYEFLYGQNKGKRDCISSRKFLQCSFFGELLFCRSQRRCGMSKWFDPQISFCEFDLVHSNINNTGGELLFSVYFHVWDNTYITVKNCHFKVKTENQNTRPRADTEIFMVLLHTA